MRAPIADRLEVAVLLPQAFLQPAAVTLGQRPAFSPLMLAINEVGLLDGDDVVVFTGVADAAPKDASVFDGGSLFRNDIGVAANLCRLPTSENGWKRASRLQTKSHNHHQARRSRGSNPRASISYSFFQAATGSGTLGDGKIFALCFERRQELHPVLHCRAMDNGVFQFARRPAPETSAMTTMGMPVIAVWQLDVSRFYNPGLARQNPPSCATCAHLNRQLLNIMQEHLNAERDLYHAAFELKDARLAHEHNLRAIDLVQRSAELRAVFDLHMRTEHDPGDDLVTAEAT